MAEATTETTIDLSNIAELVTADKIAELTEHRNCLIHGMKSLDIMRVVWELVKRLPLMRMHGMYNMEEICKFASSHLRVLGEDALTPLWDKKQKMILCPVYLPMKKQFLGKYRVHSKEREYMVPLSNAEIKTEIGLLERLILIDRDGQFYSLDSYWETRQQWESRPHYVYAGYRQLKGISLTPVNTVDELLQTIKGCGVVSFFWHAVQFLEEVLTTTLQSVRRDYEESVGMSGWGDAQKREAYLTIVQANNLFRSVRNQLHHRYGVR